jgi:hypothetical protein
MSVVQGVAPAAKLVPTSKFDEDTGSTAGCSPGLLMLVIFQAGKSLLMEPLNCICDDCVQLLTLPTPMLAD